MVYCGGTAVHSRSSARPDRRLSSAQFLNDTSRQLTIAVARQSQRRNGNSKAMGASAKALGSGTVEALEVRVSP